MHAKKSSSQRNNGRRPPASHALLLTWLLHSLPGFVGIELRDLLRCRLGRGPEILLIHDAVVVHDERHHARIAVGRGPRNQPEAADHLSLRDVLVCAAFGVRPLPLQDAVLVAMIGARLSIGALGIAFGPCTDEQRTERAHTLAR